MNQKKYHMCEKRAFIILVVLIFLLLFYDSFMNMPNNEVMGNNTPSPNIPFNPLENGPIVHNITANAQYFKNGDLIKLRVVCDQANYSIVANFSTIDNLFLPVQEQITDFKNGTYLINYTLNNANTRPNGRYQIIINTTRTATSLSTLNETLLTLDNSIPNIYIRTPQNRAFLKTSNITIEGFLNATGSKVRLATINDTRFEFLTNMTGKDVGHFVIANKSAIKEGLISLEITVYDSVSLVNHTKVFFTLDNTIPNMTGKVLAQLKNLLWITVDIDGTYSPITKFEYNITQFQIWYTPNPIGQMKASLILSNVNTEPLSDGKYILNITTSDNVNLSNSLFVPFIVDTTPPSFEAIVQNVSMPEYYHNVKISIVNPKDAVSGIKSIFLNYSINNGGSWNAINITQAQYGVIPKFPYQTRVIYKINLTDNYGNSNVSIFNYLILDHVPPRFEAITQNISMPEYYQAVKVSIINPQDLGSGIKNIILYYSTNNGTPWNAINITQAYSGVIPKFPYQTWVIYRINVTDSAGNTNTSSLYDYSIYDHVPPIIGTIQRNPLEPNQFESVNISVPNVFDAGAGIASIFLNYSVNNGNNWTLENITLTRKGLIESQPQYTGVFYQIIVDDRAGNVAKSNITDYIVQFKDNSPVYDAIVQNISAPEYYQVVEISIINPQDVGSGIKNIILYYSINNGTTWSAINLTQVHYGVIPEFPYQTQVIYRINLTDNGGNTNSSKLYSYTINDHIPPVIGTIQRSPIEPNQNEIVNITVAEVFDAGAGIRSIFLNYSVNNGLNWILENITLLKWGLIENQPPGVRILYQIIVIDKAGNEFKSNIENYTILFYYDYGRLLLFLVILGSVLAISAYSGNRIYIKRKLRKLRSEYLNEKQEFKSYTGLRLEDINILLNDIESVELNVNKLLKFQWVPDEDASGFDKLRRYRIIKEFIGITQFSNEINTIKTDWKIKNREFKAKFHILEQNIKISKQELRFIAKTDACIIALGNLLRMARKNYPLYIREKASYLQVEYPLNVFDQKLAKLINEFQANYNEFAKKFDQLLISRKSKLIEDRLNELNLIFRDTDDWLKSAEEWSKILPLPKDRGYHNLLRLKEEQYNSIKSDFQLQIEKLRADLSVSIEFAQDFMKWNYDSFINKLNKFERVISEDMVRFISIENIESSNIDSFIKEKFNSFNSMIEEDKRKVNEFYESHKEFHLQEIYDEWIALMEEMPSNLTRIRVNLNKQIQPLYRLYKLVKGETTNFYDNSLESIEKLSHLSSDSIIPGQKFSSFDELLSKIIWKANRIDNEIKKWIDLLPFDLETQHLIILLRDWNEIKEEVFERLNKFGNEKKIYKCEIMHEVLDPFNIEIWECSNCGAISCIEHLEKWYHRKQAPECFKCGKTNTFRLKTFIE